MKQSNLLLTLFSVFMSALVFTSCGDNDDNPSEPELTIGRSMITFDNEEQVGGFVYVYLAVSSSDDGTYNNLLVFSTKDKMNQSFLSKDVTYFTICVCSDRAWSVDNLQTGVFKGEQVDATFNVNNIYFDYNNKSLKYEFRCNGWSYGSPTFTITRSSFGYSFDFKDSSAKVVVEDNTSPTTMDVGMHHDGRVKDVIDWDKIVL